MEGAMGGGVGQIALEESVRRIGPHEDMATLITSPVEIGAGSTHAPSTGVGAMVQSSSEMAKRSHSSSARRLAD